MCCRPRRARRAWRRSPSSRSSSRCRANAPSSQAAAIPLFGRRSCWPRLAREVLIFAEDASPELLSIAESQPAITLVRRPWRDDDLEHADIAVGNCADRQEAERFAGAARRLGVLVNVIDQPAVCDFQFGAIVNRSPVVVGISTDGGAPVLGQAIRRRIEAILPTSLGAWGAAAKEFRERLKTIVPSSTARRRFWEKFVDVTFISQSEEDAQLAELERIAREVAAEKPQHPRVGEVVIVGAGPGDPELLTMRAVRELQAADVIVYDRLVTPGILELGRREARRVHAGKEGHGAACRQEDISALLVDVARQGKRVVRLKGGDPGIFGRTAEEVSACKSAGVPVRVVPGRDVGERRGSIARGLADASRSRPAPAVRHRPRPPRRAAGRPRPRRPRRSACDHGRLHGAAHRCGAGR